MKYLLALISIGAFAQTNVSVQATSTEALISYAAAGACTIEVSESSSFTPLVPDFDPALFASADQDLTRPTTTRSDATFRTVKAGGRIVKRDLAGIPRSRALQAGTVHYYRLCGSVTGQFTTQPIPFGLTYADPIPTDENNPGETGWPMLNYADRTKSYVDPHTGALLKRLTGPADIIDPVGVAQSTWTAWTNANMVKAASPAWSGSAFPYTITGSTEAIEANSAGLVSWGDYPFSSALSVFYGSDVGGIVNWAQIEVTAKTNQATCNTVVTDACRITVGWSTDGTTFHPLAKTTDIALTTTSTATVIGAQSYVDQGGMVKAGNRWITGVDAAPWSGTVTCNGSTTVAAVSPPFNLAWGAGSVITINGTAKRIASVTNESSLVLTSSCTTGTGVAATANNFGFLIKPKASSADTITIDNLRGKWEYSSLVKWGAASYWDYSSQAGVAGVSGADGYTVMMPTFGGVYWVNAKTGASTLIAQEITGYGLSSTSNAPLFDPLNAKAWGVLDGTGALKKYEYFGDFAERVTGPTTGFSGNGPGQTVCNSTTAPSNTPCVAVTNLTASTSLSALVTAYNPLFDASKFFAQKTAGINQDGNWIFFSWRGSAENTPAWIYVFNPNVTTNSRPGDAGCVSAAVGDATRKGCIIAALQSYAESEFRGQTLKGDVTPNIASGWIRFSPFFWSTGATYDGLGPWQMSTTGGVSLSASTCGTAGVNDCPGALNTCPANAYGISGKQCTQLVATSEPYDPTPGPTESGAAAEYITSRVGDWVHLGTVATANTTELGRILTKSGSAPAITFTIARGQTRGTAACSASPTDCGIGTLTPQTSGANPLLTYAYSTSHVYWNYTNDPDGTLSTLNDTYISNSHGSGRFAQQVDSLNPDSDPACLRTIFPSGCYRYVYTTGTIPAMMTTPGTGVSATNPTFHGQAVFGDPNNVQTHASMPGHLGNARAKALFQDNRLFNGKYFTSVGSPNAAAVSGQLYKFDATTNALGLKRKFYPTKAQIGWRPMVDISGPGSSIGTTSADSFKYCVTNVINECRSGSAVGEVYFNTPFLSTTYCANAGQAGQTGPDTTDVCILDQPMIFDSLTQVDLSAPFSLGSNSRWLGHGFAPSRMGAPFGPIQALANSAWILFRTRYLNGMRNEAMLLKAPSGTIDSRVDSRGGFIPFSVKVDAPHFAVDNAVVEFGYAEMGTTAQLYCTSRAETCGVGRASSSTIIDATTPFYFTTSETASLAGTPCASGCTIAVPSISQRVLYYRVRYRDVSNATLALSPVMAAAIN